MQVILLVSYICLLCTYSGHCTSDFRIVGGVDCLADEHRFLVSLRRSDRHICGGTLLSSKWVLTAAHCFKLYPAPTKYYSVVAGLKNINEKSNSVQSSRVYHYTVHGEYERRSYGIEHDIALILLENDISPSNTVSFVKLPSKQVTASLAAECNVSLVMGWGTQRAIPLSTSREDIKYGDDFNPNVQCVNLTVIENSECEALINISISEEQLCATGGATRDACIGDSGGPILCNKVQVGIISFGIACAVEDTAGVYMRVDSYLDFIADTRKKRKEYLMDRSSKDRSSGSYSSESNFIDKHAHDYNSTGHKSFSRQIRYLTPTLVLTIFRGIFNV